MYICLCNGITDRHIKAAVEDGARWPREVYAACRCRAQCGTCARAIREMLRGVLPADPEPDLAAAGD